MNGSILVKVFLYRITPVIWRRFSIPAESTFDHLHDVIQLAMGWENKHPHEFRHGKGKRLVDVIGPVGLQDQTPGEFQDEKAVTIASFIGRRRLPLRMLYRYDFAEDWIHELVFEKKDEDGGPARLMEGERACPPEDFGGTFQYMQALHGEIAWDQPGFEPEAFDIKAISLVPKKKRTSR